MPELPLLIFPEASVADRHKKNPPLGGPVTPTPERQVERIAPRIKELEQSFEAHCAHLKETLQGVIEPEQVVVLETVGRVADFYKAVRGIEGLEWLAEWEEEDIQPDEEFYQDATHKDNALSGLVYLVMTNSAGLKQLLRLWEAYRKDPNHPTLERGRTKWRDVFHHLRDIHPWGPVDRLRATGLYEEWSERKALGNEILSLEVELWFRNDKEASERAEKVVAREIEALKGVVQQSAYLPQIGYHALLADLPTSAVERIVNLSEVELLRCNEVMHFRPAPQCVTAPLALEEISELGNEQELPPPEGDPVVALLDGVPMSNHKLLANRLVVDDPDDWSSAYGVEERVHGTRMASLIIHGDLDKNGQPIRNPLYLRPVMKPNPRDFANRPRTEEIPGLAVDVIHRAVRRLFESDGGAPPAAPHVRIVNMSIGDSSRLFDRVPSPLAKLIDYLAFRYRLLIIVSAGNHASEIDLGIPRADLSSLRSDKRKLEKAVLAAVQKAAWARRLLSPAESINAVTVGALHLNGGGGKVVPNWVDPYASDSLPSPVNAQGPGFRRSIKPEIMLPGGRQIYSEKLGTSHSNATLRVVRSTIGPGQLVASPGTSTGDTNSAIRACGTSNSAALATRTAAQIHDTLVALADSSGSSVPLEPYLSCLIKALLVHGANWGDSRDAIVGHLGAQDKISLSCLLGYGAINQERVAVCTEQRATLIGWGELGDGQAHRYRVPLPPSLSGQAVQRTLCVTLAWLSPVDPAKSGYRVASLWLSPFGDDIEKRLANDILRVKRDQADSRRVQKGTLQHEVMTGHQAAAFVDGDVLELQVNCRSDAIPLTEVVRYALAVTLEVPEGCRIPVYSEIRARIQARVAIKARG